MWDAQKLAFLGISLILFCSICLLFLMMFVFDIYFGIEGREETVERKNILMYIKLSVMGICHFNNVIDNTLCYYVFSKSA